MGTDFVGNDGREYTRDKNDQLQPRRLKETSIWGATFVAGCLLLGPAFEKAKSEYLSENHPNTPEISQDLG